LYFLLYKYNYYKTTAMTEHKTVTWIFLYCPFVTLNVYINLYHKLPPSYYLIIYYQWAHSAVKSATKLSAEWRIFRIAQHAVRTDVILERKFFFINFDNILVQSQAFTTVSRPSSILNFSRSLPFSSIVAFQWIALLLLCPHSNARSSCLIWLLLVHLY